jgi:hypothetical protein
MGAKEKKDKCLIWGQTFNQKIGGASNQRNIEQERILEMQSKEEFFWFKNGE